MICVETVAGIREGEDESQQGRVYEVRCISYIVRTIANTPMYPHPAQQ
jgi:hypothetical protein